MDVVEHGGNCCGISHIYGFLWEEDKAGIANFKKHLTTFLDEIYVDSYNMIDGYEAEDKYDEDEEHWEVVKKEPLRKFSCILEATLTDNQMKFWAPHFKEAGFKIVNRFHNSNSGNVVNVLHYNPAGEREIPEAPYKW